MKPYEQSQALAIARLSSLMYANGSIVVIEDSAIYALESENRLIHIAPYTKAFLMEPHSNNMPPLLVRLTEFTTDTATYEVFLTAEGEGEYRVVADTFSAQVSCKDGKIGWQIT